MNVLSLFSGCGGMDFGFEGNFKCLKRSINKDIHPDWIDSEIDKNWVILKPTCFEIVFANDIRLDAKSAWDSYYYQNHKNKKSPFVVESIVNLVKRAKNGENIFPENIDIVTGGFPCQDFSIAGKRLGFNSKKNHLGIKKDSDEPMEESRGKLYVWMRDVISITKPKLFIAENVKGLTNLGNSKTIIEKDFANACNNGYIVVPAKVLFAPDYGVPQSRERVIFFGFRKDALTKNALNELSKEKIAKEYDPYPQKTHGDNLSPFVTSAEALIDLEEPEQTEDASQKKFSKAKYMGTHCQGQTEIKLTDVAPTIRSEHHGNIEYRRLSLEHYGQHFDEIKLGLKERRLTVRECARFQTFPDNYQFILPKTKNDVSVSASSAYKIIGNAVPCLFAYNIAKNIESKWEIYFGENDR